MATLTEARVRPVQVFCAAQYYNHGGRPGSARNLALTFFAVCLSGTTKKDQVPMLLVGFGFGASLWRSLPTGRGIFTKAADVGADYKED